MARPRLKSTERREALRKSQTVPVPPLNVSCLVVAKADLVAALRIYVPQLADIISLDGERFLLSLAEGEPRGDENRRAP
ncbi:MAG: hypothetical protein HYU86_10955 [Chloroflexi bacterium]|nr:hypothetical protein [Chloroflexota bacterium]